MYDILYKNSNVITVDPSFPRAGWVAVKDGKIAGLGEDEPPVANAAKVVDLKGKTILPGLIDSHAHGTVTGFSLNSINLIAATSVKDIVDAVAEKCAEKDDDEWIFATNMNLFTIDEQRPPTRWELDEISGDHPVVLVYVTLHGVAVNTKAMEMLNVPENLTGIGRDENGELNGYYTSDESSFLALSRALGHLDDEVLEKYIRDCADFAASRGVTTLHSLDGQFVEADRDFFIWLNIKDSLPINVVNYFQNTNVSLAKALGLPRLGGCLTLDGTGFEHTMAITDPYPDGLEPTHGYLYWEDEDVYKFVSQVHRAGMQCGMHCLGDRAIEQLLTAYERVIAEQGNPKGLRHRIEHFALCNPDQIKRACKLGLVFPMQPIFTYLWDNPNIPGGDTYKNCLGEKYAQEIDPFPAILAEGGVICGGSDSAVTEINPILGIHSAANAPNPVRRVSLDDAIKMYTINGAYAAHEEDIKGSIEIGKNADLTIVDKDPYAFPEAIDQITVEMTIVNGKAVYVK